MNIQRALNKIVAGDNFLILDFLDSTKGKSSSLNSSG